MSKQLITIKPHSIIDVITNSSSELFVCSTDKSVDTISESLHLLLDTCNSINNENRDFDDVFGSIYEITEDNIRNFFDDYVCGWGFRPDWNLPKIKDHWDLYEEYDKLNGPQPKYGTEEFDTYNIKRSLYASNYIEEFFKNHYVTYKKSLIGLIVINSAGDNSIPYELFDMIESAFNVNRIHLG